MGIRKRMAVFTSGLVFAGATALMMNPAVATTTANSEAGIAVSPDSAVRWQRQVQPPPDPRAREIQSLRQLHEQQRQSLERALSEAQRQMDQAAQQQRQALQRAQQETLSQMQRQQTQERTPGQIQEGTYGQERMRGQIQEGTYGQERIQGQRLLPMVD